jgi:hypothetical protein
MLAAFITFQLRQSDDRCDEEEKISHFSHFISSLLN